MKTCIVCSNNLTEKDTLGSAIKIYGYPNHCTECFDKVPAADRATKILIVKNALANEKKDATHE